MQEKHRDNFEGLYNCRDNIKISLKDMWMKMWTGFFRCRNGMA
jgi:hypothetical protein